MYNFSDTRQNKKKPKIIQKALCSFSNSGQRVGDNLSCFRSDEDHCAVLWRSNSILSWHIIPS